VPRSAARLPPSKTWLWVSVERLSMGVAVVADGWDDTAERRPR
jgi:hypothetical protein